MEVFSPEKCKKLLQIIAGTYDKDDITMELAEVNSVDTTQWTCNVTTTSGLAAVTYANVQLAAEKGSDGFILVPKVGSNVLISITVRNEVYVYMCSDIDSIHIYRDNGDGTFTGFVIGQTIKINDGSYGGLVIGGTPAGLQAQVNNLSNQVQTLVNLLTTWVPVPNDGGAALKSAATAALPALPVPDFSQILSTYINHGKP